VTIFCSAWTAASNSVSFIVLFSYCEYVNEYGSSRLPAVVTVVSFTVTDEGLRSEEGLISTIADLLWIIGIAEFYDLLPDVMNYVVAKEGVGQCS